MAWSLNFRGGAIQIPKITFTGDFSVTISATQVVGGRFFCGSDNTAGSLELYRNNSSKLQLFIGNVAQFAGATNLSANVNTPDLIVASRVGSTLSIFVNGTLQGTATFSGNMSVAWFGLRTGWSNYPDPMRLYYADLQDIANPSNSRYYDPSLSGGTGDTLPTTSGANAGTQFNNWPLDDSEWVFYSSGGAFTLSADGGTFTYTGAAAILLANRTLSSNGGSFSYSGASATLRINRLLQADGASFSYSGASANLLLNRLLSADGGLFSYSGAAATLTYTPITGYVLSADGATFNYFGADAALNYSQNFPEANPSDFTVSSLVDSSFAYTSSISPTVGFSAMISSTFKYNGSLN